MALLDRNIDHGLRYSPRKVSAEDPHVVLTQLLAPLHAKPSDLASRLLSRFGTLGGLTRATEQELRQEAIEDEGWVQPFISVRKLLILGVSEDLRRTKLGERSQELHRFLFASLGNLPDERLAAIYADRSGHVIGEGIISRGSSDRLLLLSRSLFSQALKLDARRLVIAHNHPSGDASPSQTDIRTTKTLARQARELGVILEDHLIVAANKIFSMKAGGML